jgi:hypothetical protein
MIFCDWKATHTRIFFKVRIGSIFPPRSGFVQPDAPLNGDFAVASSPPVSFIVRKKNHDQLKYIHTLGQVAP